MKENSIFPNASREEWTKRVAKELGDSVYDSLTWRDENGLTLEAGYGSSSEMQLTNARDRRKTAGLRQDICATDAKSLNQLLLQSLSGGVSEIGVANLISSEQELEIIFEGIQTEIIGVHFTHPGNPVDLCGWLTNYRKKSNLDAHSWKGSFSWQPVLREVPLSAYLPSIQKMNDENPGMKLINIPAFMIHEQGGNAVQEIAFALSCGNENLHQLVAAGLKPDLAASNLTFDFGTGSSFFVEIAKFEVFRKLWSKLLGEYGIEGETTLHARTSAYHQSAKGIHNNLLRGTTQCMSAMLGGADTIEILPYDQVSFVQSEHSLRLARNVYHLLINESHFADAIHATHGMVYLEEIEKQLGQLAWNKFVEMEKSGGFISSKNVLENEVKKVADQRQELLQKGNRVMVGVNKFADATEQHATGTTGRLSSILDNGVQN